jgi:hypothetical protein
MFGNALKARRPTNADRIYLRDVNTLRLRGERDFRQTANTVIRSEVIIDNNELIRLINSGYVDGAAELVTSGVSTTMFAPMSPITLGIMANMGALEAMRAGSMLNKDIIFSPLKDRPYLWARDHAAEMVKGVTDETRKALRSVIANAVADNAHPRGQRMITEIKSLVGLTERHAAAVWKYRAAQIDAGKPMDLVTRKVERYADRLKRVRAENIARTETATAIGKGREEAWDQFVEEGNALASEMQRTWITAVDEKVCDLCAPMNGQQRGIHESFTDGDGNQIDEVPAHSSCRCDILYDFKENL